MMTKRTATKNLLMGVMNEDKGALLKKMSIWAKEIRDAYEIVSANSKHWEVA